MILYSALLVRTVLDSWMIEYVMCKHVLIISY
jgi:hypothetical protein